MFQDLEIRNFRLFEHLKLENLGQINLLAGENNSGKTSVLEALCLLSGAGNPQLILGINGYRYGEIHFNEKFREIHFNPLFNQFNCNNIIEIIGKKDSLGPVKLEIQVERKDLTSIPLNNSPAIENKSFATISQNVLKANTEQMYSGLRLQYTLNKFNNESNESEKIQRVNFLRVEGDVLKIKIDEDSSHKDFPIKGAFISWKTDNIREDATALGELRKRKQADSLVDVLKIIEPRLVDLEEISLAGHPMIWGDIGLAELVPLPMMGEGMTHVARIFLAMPQAAGGILLIDEIENGIHYSALEKLWTAIAAAAERAQVQVFATTHSFECMAAAHRALGEKLAFHRIDEGREGGKRCVTFESKELEIAIERGWEVR